MKKTYLVALLAVCLASACGKKADGPDCRKVSAHVITLIRAELAKQNTSAELESAQANLPTLQDALTTACEEKQWSTASRECVLGAKTAAETEACDPGLSEATTPADSESSGD